jgi:hypothetical protein
MTSTMTRGVMGQMKAVVHPLEPWVESWPEVLAEPEPVLASEPVLTPVQNPAGEPGEKPVGDPVVRPVKEPGVLVATEARVVAIHVARRMTRGRGTRDAHQAGKNHQEKHLQQMTGWIAFDNSV